MNVLEKMRITFMQAYLYGLAWLESKRADSSAGFVGKILGLVIAVYVAAYTLPSAIVALSNETEWTGAPTAVITLGTTVASIVAVVVFVWMLIKSGTGGD